jgi:histidine triad (HIT) family protein
VGTCIFCMVASGEMDARKVYEDDLVVAFDDIAPQAPVHTLIIPKVHHDDLGDGLSPELVNALFAAVPKVAEIKGVAQSGYRVIVNNGRDANQTVGHLHVHVLGGKAMSHGMVMFVSE